MNDFLARNSNLQPSRIAERAGKPVLEAQASNGANERGNGNRPAATRGEADGDIERQLSTAAEVADAQAKVAALLSDLSAMQNAGMMDVDALEAQISALLPRPTVIVPLPPADREAVERAVQIAESIRRSGMLAIVAQANVDGGVARGIIA